MAKQIIDEIMAKSAGLEAHRAENYTFAEAASDIMNEVGELMHSCARMDGKDVECAPFVHLTATILQAGFEITLFEDERGGEHTVDGSAKIWLSHDDFKSKNPALKKQKAIEAFKKVESWKAECWALVNEVSEFQLQPEFDEVEQLNHDFKASVRPAA